MSAPNKAAMLGLPLEKKWQIWTSRRGVDEADTNLSNNPEDYTQRLRDLAMVSCSKSRQLIVALIHHYFLCAVAIPKFHGRGVHTLQKLGRLANCFAHPATQLCVKIPGGRRPQLSSQPSCRDGLGHRTIHHPHRGSRLCQSTHEQLGMKQKNVRFHDLSFSLARLEEHTCWRIPRASTPSLRV